MFRPFLEKEENIDPKDLESLKLDDTNATNIDTSLMPNGDSKLHNGVETQSSASSDEIDNFDENGVVNNNNNNNNEDSAKEQLSEMPNGHVASPTEVADPAGLASRQFFKVSAVYSTGSTEIQKLPKTGSFKLSGKQQILLLNAKVFIDANSMAII